MVYAILNVFIAPHCLGQCVWQIHPHGKSADRDLLFRARLVRGANVVGIPFTVAKDAAEQGLPVTGVIMCDQDHENTPPLCQPVPSQLQINFVFAEAGKDFWNSCRFTSVKLFGKPLRCKKYDCSTDFKHPSNKIQITPRHKNPCIHCL